VPLDVKRSGYGAAVGRIVVHEYITLDGVIEDPRWTADYPCDPEMGAAIDALMGASKALLVGRRTYEELAGGESLMNEKPTYVVSGSLKGTDLDSASVLGPYEPEIIQSLKDRIDGDIYVNGSGMLVHALLEDRLVDELHLFVFPVALGSGWRLFPDGGSPTRLELTGTEAYDGGIVHLTLKPAVR
jgi:dihydrofolate reductase